MNSAVSPDRQSVILLGASNLALGWKPLLRALHATVAGPLDVRVAMGLGRSYVGSSRVLFRRLPGIVNCGLWENLPAAGEKPPLVLFTDLGNDLVYMHSRETILSAVETCLHRILDWRPDAHIVITGLPLASILSLGPKRFLIARSILFPGCFLSLPEARSRSAALDQSLCQIAQQHSIPWVAPQREWYRSDPIHVIKPLREDVFRLFFSHWKLPSKDAIVPRHLPQARLPASERQIICGFQRRVRQPVVDTPELVVSAW